MSIEAYNKRAHLAMDPDSTSCVFVEKINMTANNFGTDFTKAYSSTQTYTLTGYSTMPILFLHTAKKSTTSFATSIFINNLVVVDSLVSTSAGVWELRLSFTKYLLPPNIASASPSKPIVMGVTAAYLDSIISDYTIYAFKEIDPNLDVSADPFVLKKSNGDVSFASSQKVLKGRALYSASVLRPTTSQTGWNTGSLTGMVMNYGDQKGTAHTMGTYSAADIAELKLNPYMAATGVSTAAIDALSSGGTLGIAKPAVRLRVRSEVHVSTDIAYGFQATPTLTIPPINVINPFLPGGDMEDFIGHYYNAEAPVETPPLVGGSTNAWNLYITTRPVNSIGINYGTFSFTTDGWYFYSAWRQEVRPTLSIGPTHAIEAWTPVHTQLIKEAPLWVNIPANTYTDLTDFTTTNDPIHSQNTCLSTATETYTAGAYGLETGTSYVIIDGADYD